MAQQLNKLTLEELYGTGKATPGVMKYIRSMEDFSHVSPRYCSLCPAEMKGAKPTINPIWKKVTGEEERPVAVLLPHRYQDEIRGGYVARTGKEREQRIIRILGDFIKPPTMYLPAYICTQSGYNVKMGVVKHCSMYIKEHFKAVKPQAILACGPNAVAALGLKGSRGDTLEWEGTPVVVTYDPRIVFMLRQNSSGDTWGPDYLAVLKRDTDKINKLCRGIRPPSLTDAVEVAKGKVNVVTTLKGVERMVGKLSTQKVISCDIETTGLDPWAENAKVLTVQFGTEDGESAWVVTLWHKDWKKYDSDEAWNLIAPLLVDPEILKVGHNIKFDTLYLWVVKRLKMGPVEDTMIYLHSLNSGVQGEYGLKSAVQDYLWETGLGGYEDLLGAAK